MKKTNTKKYLLAGAVITVITVIAVVYSQGEYFAGYLGKQMNTFRMKPVAQEPLKIDQSVRNVMDSKESPETHTVKEVTNDEMSIRSNDIWEAIDISEIFESMPVFLEAEFLVEENANSDLSTRMSVATTSTTYTDLDGQNNVENVYSYDHIIVGKPDEAGVEIFYTDKSNPDDAWFSSFDSGKISPLSTYGSDVSASGYHVLISDLVEAEVRKEKMMSQGQIYMTIEGGLDIQSPESFIDFGKSVDISVKDDNNHVVAVGAPKANNVGKVFVYHTVDGAKSEFDLSPSGLSSYANFGFSVAVSPDGKKIIVGAPFDKTQNGTGSVHIFEYNQVANDWLNTKTIKYPIGVGQFGYVVDIADDMLVIGDPYRDYNVNLSYPLGTGSDQADRNKVIRISEGKNVLGFAQYMALEEVENAEVSYSYEGGIVQIYNLQNGEWEFDQELQSFGGGEKFGLSVVIGPNNRVAVGHGVTLNSKGVAFGTTGQVLVYEKKEKWEPEYLITPPTGDDIILFGSDIALGDGYLAITGAGGNYGNQDRVYVADL